MTNVGLNDLKERIRNIPIYPPTGIRVEELGSWLRGVEYMRAIVINLIKDLEDSQHA